MKVLINALQANNRSGTGVYAAQLAKRLPRIAHPGETVFAWPKDLAVPDQGRRPNATFVARGHAGPLARLRYDQWGIRADLRALRADVVHYPANVGCVTPLRNMVVTIHDMTFFLHPEWFRYERAQYYRWAVARSARHAARIIAVSRASANDIVEVLRIPADRIDVVYQGADERFAPATEIERAAARAKYDLPERFVLCYGTIEPRKNLGRLIQAWSSIADTVEHDLVIAGRMGWKTQPVVDAADRSPHRARIHFPGFVSDDDLPAVIGAADAVALPSLYEGFGIGIVESMACGVPVVTSNISSMPEVAGGAAVLVDPLDVESIADGLRRAIGDAAMRSECITRGRARAKEFSWTKTAEGALRAYRAVAAGG